MEDINLVRLFEVIVKKIPEADTWLAPQHKEENTSKKAEEIRKGLFSNKQRLEAIKDLNLKEENLAKLPKEIGLFTLLQTLDLHSMHHLEINYYYSNKLRSLPKEIGNLKQLEELDLGNNQLVSLPPEMGNLKQLKRLNLRNNKLTGQPPEISPSNS